jgi:hypothetical protein
MGVTAAWAAEATTKPAKVEKPEIVTREQWGSEPQDIPDSRKHVPKYITIHHAGVEWKAGADPAKFVKSMQAWGQREKKWPDLAYHFLIAPDGRIFEARKLEYEPESNTKYDLQGHIGVELMGNFETQRMTEAQLKSMVNLVAWLTEELNIDPANIAGHKDRAKGQTSCPGKDCYRYIEDGSVRGWVEKLRAGEQADVKLKEAIPGGPEKFVGE